MKKSLSLLMAILLVFMLCSCGNSSANSTKSEKKNLEELYAETVDELISINEEVNICYLTVLTIWEVSGTSDFYTYYNAMLTINDESSFELHSNPSITKWLLANALCPEEATYNSATDEGVEYIVNVCSHYNNTMRDIDKRYEEIAEKIKSIENEEQKNLLQEWYIESQLFSDAAFEPDGSYSSYKSNYDAFKTNIDKFQKSAELY